MPGRLSVAPTPLTSPSRPLQAWSTWRTAPVSRWTTTPRTPSSAGTPTRTSTSGARTARRVGAAPRVARAARGGGLGVLSAAGGLACRRPGGFVAEMRPFGVPYVPRGTGAACLGAQPQPSPAAGARGRGQLAQSRPTCRQPGSTRPRDRRARACDRRIGCPPGGTAWAGAGGPSLLAAAEDILGKGQFWKPFGRWGGCRSGSPHS